VAVQHGSYASFATRYLTPPSLNQSAINIKINFNQIKTVFFLGFLVNFFQKYLLFTAKNVKRLVKKLPKFSPFIR